MKFLEKILPVITAEAHCDIPCGIYDPTPAKIAAMTVLRMVLQIKELEGKNDYHGIVRRTAVKEQHAELCKKELQILWSDFFKPEHLQKNPDLHEKFWKALKLCSKNKQSVDEEAARALIAAVDELAEIFYEAKNAPERLKAYHDITDKLF